jgi:hypothetical protein
MTVVTIHVVKQAPHVFAQGIIDDQERLTPVTTMGFRLVQHEVEPATIHRVLPPGGFRKEAGEIGFVGALQGAAGDIGQAFVW